MPYRPGSIGIVDPIIINNTFFGRPLEKRIKLYDNSSEF
jgi:hypothetical protein